MWTHLERQRGGIGMRGPGETQIETDRRIILDKISRLKEELRHIDRQKSMQRKNRGKLTRVALVGYTNVGKSTLWTSTANFPPIWWNHSSQRSTRFATPTFWCMWLTSHIPTSRSR